MATTISTKELINAYFENEVEETSRVKIRNHLDRDELYAYEEKIGKQLVEMSFDEIFDMVFSFNNARRGDKKDSGLSRSSIINIISKYRLIIYYYSDHYSDTVINNPLRSSIQCSKEINRRFGERDGFKRDDFDELIRKIRTTYNSDNATYIECLVRLFYDGFRDFTELVLLKKDQIDFEKKTVTFEDRVVQLSDRTFELLIYVASMDSFEAEIYTQKMVSWRGGYFKYPVRRKNSIENFDGNELEEVMKKASVKFYTNLRDLTPYVVNPNALFFLGFLEKLIKKYGYDEITDMFYRKDRSDIMRIIKTEGAKYGINLYNPSVVRTKLESLL